MLRACIRTRLKMSALILFHGLILCKQVGNVANDALLELEMKLRKETS